MIRKLWILSILIAIDQEIPVDYYLSDKERAQYTKKLIEYLNQFREMLAQEKLNLNLEKTAFINERTILENNLNTYKRNLLLKEQDLEKREEKFAKYLNIACDFRIYSEMEDSDLAALLDSTNSLSDAVCIFNTLNPQKKSRVLSKMKKQRVKTKIVQSLQRVKKLKN